MTCPRCSGALKPCDSDWLLACADCQRRWPPPANLVRELAEEREKVTGLEAALSRALEERDAARGNFIRARDTRDAAILRAGRYRSRLARVLRLVKADRDWVGIHCGGVWSRHVTKEPQP